MTINAVFADIRLALGHTSMPSILSQATFLANRGDNSKSLERYQEVKAFVAQAKDKLRIWDERYDLDAEMAKAFERLTVTESMLARDAIEDVRTGNEQSGALWPAMYYAMSQEEIGRALPHLNTLRRTVESLTALIAVGVELAKVPAAGGLFEEVDWGPIRQSLASNASALELSIQGTLLKGVGLEGVEISVDTNPKTDDEKRKEITSIVDYLTFFHGDIRSRLLREFIPNEAVAPLPPPFVVDLRPREPVSETPGATGSNAQVVNLHHDLPKIVRIARLGCGIPESFFQTRFDGYKDDTCRDIVWKLMEAAAGKAKEHGANLMLFPEYCVPRSRLPQLEDIARRHSMTIVGGIEGGTDADSRLVDEVFVCFADRAPYQQRKKWPSEYEPLLAPSGSQRIFQHTPIGTFSVILCSDLLQLDILTTLSTSQVSLDFILICAFNPNPPLFETLARADSLRFYTYVVITNNYSGREGVSGDFGSGVAMPHRRWDDGFEKDKPPAEVYPLAVPGTWVGDPRIVIHELNLDWIDKDVRKSQNAQFMAPPRCLNPE